VSDDGGISLIHCERCSHKSCEPEEFEKVFGIVL
jgi:hypothetical protein